MGKSGLLSGKCTGQRRERRIMKKKVIIWIVAGILVFLLAALVLFDLNKGDSKDKKLTEVTLAEVTHSIFYAPQYVAIEKGYFEEVGIDIELILTSGADKVTAAVLSGDADIGFCGSEGTIYVYQGGEKDYLKTFAQLTQKDGSFIVSREKIKDFTLEDLKGKEILGGRAGGMPEMTLEYALKENGIDPKKDVNINTSIEFASMGGAFIGGEGDFVTLFEPNALELEKEGYVETIPGKGTYVANKNTELIKEEQLQKIEGLIDTAVSIAKISGISKEDIKEMLDILYEEE